MNVIVADDNGTEQLPTRGPLVDDDGLDSFMAVQRQLFGIATRMLGSAAEADDVIQDVWIRWQAYDRTTVRNAAAFLTTTTTRLAINVSQSARVRREASVGAWLPEIVDASADPTRGSETTEAVTLAIGELMGVLSPTERAAYVLREAFDYRYERIAEILGLSVVNARQLVSRGRRRLHRSATHDVVDIDHQRQLLTAFVAAAHTGEMGLLEALLANDAQRALTAA